MQKVPVGSMQLDQIEAELRRAFRGRHKCVTHPGEALLV